MSEIPARPGSYALWLRIANESGIQIGRLGWGVFPAGDYLYFGSAHGPGGLRARTSHHLRPVERPHWHLDWLRGLAAPLGVWWVAGTEPLECQMGATLKILGNIDKKVVSGQSRGVIRQLY